MRRSKNKISVLSLRFSAISAVNPEFSGLDMLIVLLTDPDDIVIDPFAGSNTLGMVAEKLGRRWAAMEMEEEYLHASKFRFEELD